jgi:hypothetical protein
MMMGKENGNNAINDWKKQQTTRKKAEAFWEEILNLLWQKWGAQV